MAMFGPCKKIAVPCNVCPLETQRARRNKTGTTAAGGSLAGLDAAERHGASVLFEALQYGLNGWLHLVVEYQNIALNDSGLDISHLRRHRFTPDPLS